MDNKHEDHYFFIYNSPGDYHFCESDGQAVGWIFIVLAILLIIFGLT